MRCPHRTQAAPDTPKAFPLKVHPEGRSPEHERFGINSPVDCLWRISHAQHRNRPKDRFGAQGEGGALRRGEALEVERFGAGAPVERLRRISRPQHRTFPKGKFGAQYEVSPTAPKPPQTPPKAFPLRGRWQAKGLTDEVSPAHPSRPRTPLRTPPQRAAHTAPGSAPHTRAAPPRPPAGGRGPVTSARRSPLPWPAAPSGPPKPRASSPRSGRAAARWGDRWAASTRPCAASTAPAPA